MNRVRDIAQEEMLRAYRRSSQLLLDGAKLMATGGLRSPEEKAWCDAVLTECSKRCEVEGLLEELLDG